MIPYPCLDIDAGLVDIYYKRCQISAELNKVNFMGLNKESSVYKLLNAKTPSNSLHIAFCRENYRCIIKAKYMVEL